jgi:hypothetical protein
VLTISGEDATYMWGGGPGPPQSYIFVLNCFTPGEYIIHAAGYIHSSGGGMALPSISEITGTISCDPFILDFPYVALGGLAIGAGGTENPTHCGGMTTTRNQTGLGCVVTE